MTKNKARPRPLTKCTICNSIYRKNVDDMLEKKVPQTVIVAFLKDKGIKLSVMSVSRHLHKCILGEGSKSRQISKEGIRKAQQKARNVKKKSTTKRAAETTKNMIANNPDYLDHKNPARQKAKYQQQLKQMEKDINVINEFVFLLSAAKRRIQRAMEEEEESQLVLATTGKAMADYGVLLQKFNEITQGMESLQSLRYAELIQMIANIFAKSPISDQTRKDILSVVNQYIEEEEIDEEMKISLIPNKVKNTV